MAREGNSDTQTASGISTSLARSMEARLAPATSFSMGAQMGLTSSRRLSNARTTLPGPAGRGARAPDDWEVLIHTCRSWRRWAKGGQMTTSKTTAGHNVPGAGTTEQTQGTLGPSPLAFPPWGGRRPPKRRLHGPHEQPMNSQPDWEAVRARLGALHRLRVRNLPTRLLVTRTLVLALLSIGFAVFFVAAGSALIGILFFVGALPLAISTWERARSIRTGKIRAGWIERVFEPKRDATSSGLTVTQAVVTRDVGDIKDALELVGEKLLAKRNLFGGRGTRRKALLENAAALTSKDLSPDEKQFLTMRATIAPNGLKRMFPPAGKGGWLTVTDQRVMFHRVSRSWVTRQSSDLLLAEPLFSTNIAEWFRGLWPSERLDLVLVIKCSDGSQARFNINRFQWRNEGQATFELIASACPNPPPALAHYWRAEGLAPTLHFVEARAAPRTR
jgi:hypothetical protein